MNLIDLSIRRPKAMTMATTFLLVIGLLALRKIAVDLYPNVSYPVLVVRAQLPGAAPEEVEQLVTKKMEDVLSTIAGVNTLRSVSRDSTSMVILEFDSGVDVRFQEIQVRGKIANLRASLPDELNDPEIFRQDPDDTPVIEISVTGERSAAEITRIADDAIALRLRQLKGVGEVSLSGDRRPEIRVEVEPVALDQWHLNLKDVVQAVRGMNRNDPAGRLRGQDRQWLLRSAAALHSAADLAAIPVARSATGGSVVLGDVATITSGFEEVRRVSRFGDREGLKPAVLLQVVKQSGENTVAVSDRVRATLDELRSTLPVDVRVVVTRDNADLVRDNVADVGESLIFGAILTVVVVLLFLRSVRATLTTALSLPSSVITTFAVMFAAGFTVNVMTLLALSLAIGLLVDDAIVVRENIFRHLGSTDPKSAAAKGAREVQLAVVATTLTIVAVFLPVGFMGGVSGQFFKQFALTVVFAVLVSLYDAMTMAPMLSAYFAYYADPAVEWAAMGRLGRAFDRGLAKFEHGFARVALGYERLLRWLLPRPLLPVSIAALALGAAIWGFQVVKKSFLPSQFGKVFSASLSGPLAVPLERVQDIADAAERRLRDVRGLENWTISAGLGFAGNANIDMTLRARTEFAKNQDALGALRTDVRQALQDIPGYNLRVSEPADPLSGSSGRFQPLAVLVLGEDIANLRVIARKVRQLMVETPGVADVATLQDEGLPEIAVLTDARLAGRFGVTADMVSSALSTAVAGDASNSIRMGDEDVPVRVVLAGANRSTPGALLGQNIYVRPGSPGVAIGSVARVQTGAGASIINRENRQRVIRVGANLAPKAALGDLVSTLQGKLDSLPLPQGYSVRIAGQSEQMNELYANVGLAVGIGSLFVYMILVSLFESFMQPLTVMAAIPLAATGAVLALLLVDAPLDLYAGVGMILLAGIVAKNSILLVDFAMQQVRDKGVAPKDAILAAAPLRLRPIIMTSVAMTAGMIPVAMGVGASGAARRALGVATIGGVVSSTVLTLLVVPSLYLGIERLFRWRRR